MDVEKIQKMNNLALDLMKQGLAENREDAFAQAEKIYQGDSEELNSIKERMKESEPQDDDQPQEELSQDKIKDILAQNTKFLVKTITEFRGKIDLLEKELKEIKSKIAYNNIPSAGEILTKETNKNLDNLDHNKDVPKNHPRYGSFADTDVSIEKFFYMGNK